MLSKWKVKKLGFHRLRDSRPATPGHTFLHSKKNRETKGKKRKNFKGETIKRLSARSKCYCFSHSRVSRIFLQE